MINSISFCRDKPAVPSDVGGWGVSSAFLPTSFEKRPKVNLVIDPYQLIPGMGYLILVYSTLLPLVLRVKYLCLQCCETSK
jgi:hypothetical protein